MVLLCKDPAVAVLTQNWRAPGCGCLELVLCRAMMKIYSGQTGGKILPARGCHDGKVDQYRSFLSLVLFKLEVPPPQLEVVGPYLVWGTWFHSRLPLEETSHI
jgi:hypothetical protein